MVNAAKSAAEAGRHLLDLLSANAPKDQIYGAMRAIMTPLATAKDQILAAARAQGREIGVDEAGNILEPMVAMVVLSQPGLEDKLAKFLVRDDVDADFTMDETQPASAMISFLGFKREPGANAALPVELPRLAKLYAFYKTAAGATPEAALQAILDPSSKASRLMSYGGRFAESAENFRAGLRLLDAFNAWYDRLSADIADGKTGTPTLLKGYDARLKPIHKRAHERFIFEEIAVNPSLSLAPRDPEETFGMKNNPATRFVGRNYMVSMTNTLARIPPAKRSLLYAVFDAMSPLKRHAGDNAETRFSLNTILTSRVLKNYDEVAALRASGQLDRAHIIQLLFSDFNIPPTATNQQIFSIQSGAMLSLATNELRAKPELIGPAQLLLERTGATKQEVVTALLENQVLPNAPYIATIATPYESLDTPADARAAKEMAVSFATVASRNLVAGEGPNAHVDVEKDHAQLKRDLAGGYRYHFPGGLPPTNDYNEVRNRFVRFLTRRNNTSSIEARSWVITGSVGRQSASSARNDAVCELFKSIILRMFGGTDENKLPEPARTAMKFEDYGQGKPLSARRIKTVKAAVDQMKAAQDIADNAAAAPAPAPSRSAMPTSTLPRRSSRPPASSTSPPSPRTFMSSIHRNSNSHGNMWKA